jgi:phage recombination protein Bet
MTTALSTVETSRALAIQEDELIPVLQSSLYPGANVNSVRMVLGYCKAAGLDPMQKPVHIVPMWDSKAGNMRDVVMPGIGLYRTQAMRSGECAGITEPEYGPDVTQAIGGQTITFPAWCRVTVKRRLPSGEIADFTAKEFWLENYAIKGGKEKSVAPNAMWTKRPYGQLAKCAEAQALRRAFPELGSQPTSDESIIDPSDIAPLRPAAVVVEVADFGAIMRQIDAAQTVDELNALRAAIRTLDRDARAEAMDAAKVRADQIRAAQEPAADHGGADDPI